ncbi:MAG TPA: addiction module protein [Pyrinomonadaceae bacterium]|nr:addiction module protein [Pyrinomonadaceae bacterium]
MSTGGKSLRRTSIDDRPFRTSATAPHGRPVKVDQTPNETAAESVRNDKLAYTGRDEKAGNNMDDTSEHDVEVAWSVEIERRLVEIDAGMVELIPWDDVSRSITRRV